MSYQVYCDSRELRSPVIKELDRMGANITVKILEVGDYVISDRVAFERKTVDDFLKSWIDEKKLFTQIYDLKVSYERPILLVEGFQDDLYTARRINPVAVQGVINSIAVMGVPTLYTGSPKGTAQIIAMIARREQEENKRLPSAHGKRSHMTQDEQLTYIISAIPGIGPQTATDLLVHFGTIEEIARAGIWELQEVANVGEKTADAIRNTMTARYRQK